MGGASPEPGATRSHAEPVLHGRAWRGLRGASPEGPRSGGLAGGKGRALGPFFLASQSSPGAVNRPPVIPGTEGGLKRGKYLFSLKILSATWNSAFFGGFPPFFGREMHILGVCIPHLRVYEVHTFVRLTHTPEGAASKCEPPQSSAWCQSRSG